MNIDNIGLFSALKTKMSWLGQRQNLVAENVANATTPGYQPRDMKALDFAAAMKKTSPDEVVTLRKTSNLHMSAPGEGNKSGKPVKAKDSETTMDGNSVVMEEQMIKMADSRMQFDAAVGFYQKSLELLRTASQRPR
jgi:flagellar basal-body rod protein FlgB